MSDQNEQYEELVMGLVGFAGEARSLAFEALKISRTGNIAEAEKMLAEAKKTVHEAHHIQTDLITAEINGSGKAPTLLMVHAQDHLMTAMLAIDLITELIEEKKK
ncbi:MAG: PTS lactose/cellobiose transporter subunit IIA [Brevinema sp.]